MAITTVTSREFNQGISKSKKVCESEPVYATYRGWPTHVFSLLKSAKSLLGQIQLFLIYWQWMIVLVNLKHLGLNRSCYILVFLPCEQLRKIYLDDTCPVKNFLKRQ